jgi:hypothetical protein
MSAPRLLASLLLGLIAASCGADHASNSGGKATLEVWGTWKAPLPDEARFLLTVVNCPFTMPPEYDALGTIEDGIARARIDGITPGQWCLTAVIDMDPNDGLLPKPGFDITIVGLALNESLPVTLEDGKTTVVEVALELILQSPADVVEAPDLVDDTDEDGTPEEAPGPDDVWLKLTVDCPTCATSAPLVFYGYAGEEMGTIPELHNKFSQAVAFPGSWVIKESGPFAQGAIAAGTYIVSAYQDLDDKGMMPEAGEPTAQARVVNLLAGEWNAIDLTLE